MLAVAEFVAAEEFLRAYLLKRLEFLTLLANTLDLAARDEL